MLDRVYYYWHKLRTTPPQMVIKIAFGLIKQRAFAVLDKISAHLFGTEMSDQAFFNKLGLQDITGLQAYLHYRSMFFFASDSRQEIISAITKHSPQMPNRTLLAADKVCKHIFNLLGSGDVYLGETINWHSDFKSGYYWSVKKYYKAIKIPYGKADIKLPWELSRFQHLAVLGQAYWLTDKAEYREEFVNQITDWIENNPLGFGVNWACPMDVAIRAVNWVFGFYFFAEAKEILDEFWLKFLKSLFSHGCFIFKNLEVIYTDNGKRVTSNHYLSDIAGLIFLGLFFKETKEGKQWLEFGVKELINEIELQVHQDGADFESSIPYHRLVLELFAIPALLCKINQIELPQRFWERLEKMFVFVMYYTKPDGQMPQLGDNDNGRLVILNNYGCWQVNDHRYLLGLGAILFNRPDLASQCQGQWEEAFWLTNRLPKTKNLDIVCQPIESKPFPESGYYIMRHKDNYLIISAGGVGTLGIGNHKHNDVFSFELCLKGKTIIIDPGTYVYTSNLEMRNLFRSTAYHNTVMIDRQEQNRWEKRWDKLEKRLFQMKDDAKPKCLKWEIGDNVDTFIGEHDGYKRLAQPVIHQREIRFYKRHGCLEVIDRLNGEKECDLEWNLILYPGIEGIQLSSDRLQWHKEPAFYSSGYGVKQQTQKLTSRLKAVLPIEIVFSIQVSDKNGSLLILK